MRTITLFALLALPLLLATACVAGTNNHNYIDATDTGKTEIPYRSTSNENQNVEDDNQDTSNENQNVEDDDTGEQNVGLLKSCDNRGQSRCGDDGVPYFCKNNMWVKKYSSGCSDSQICKDGECVAFEGFRCHSTDQTKIREYGGRYGHSILACPERATCESDQMGEDRCVCEEGYYLDDKDNDDIHDDTCESVQCTSNSECGEGTCEEHTCVIDCPDRYFCGAAHQIFREKRDVCGEGTTLKCCPDGTGHSHIKSCMSSNVCQDYDIIQHTPNLCGPRCSNDFDCGNTVGGSGSYSCDDGICKKQ